MLNVVGMPGSCSGRVISGFAYDRNGGYGWEPGAAVKEIFPFLTRDVYKSLELIVLNQKQKDAAKEVIKAGFVCLGEYLSAHADGTRCFLYARGIIGKRGKKFKLPKVKLRRIKKV